MANDSVMIPSLFGGVSTQSPASRFPNQVTSATNALLSVRSGMELRPGTSLEFAVATDTGLKKIATGGNYRIHPIKRDNTEKYLVWFGDTGGDLTFRVFEPSAAAAAKECTVTMSADALTYLGLNNATADQLRLITIADYTLILNTTVAVTASDYTQYAVTQTHRDYDVMLAHTPADHTYHKTNASTASEVKGYYYYNLTGGSYPTWHRNADTFAYTWFKDAGRNPGGFKVAMWRLPLVNAAGGSSWDLATMTLTTTSLVMTHTYTAGDQLKITGGTGMTPGWYTISSMPTTSSFVLATSPGANATDVTHTAIGHEYTVSVNMETTTLADMYDVAQVYQDALRADGCTNGLIEWVETEAGKGYFVITGNWPGLNNIVEMPTDPGAIDDHTDAGTDPFYPGTGAWPGNISTAVTGAGLQSGTTTPESRWTKVPGPGSVDAILDVATLPVKMVRTSVSSGATPAVFTVSQITWSQRLSGDDATNPVLSLWENGRTIRDITFHRNRLWLMGGENVVSSQAGDFFNFFIEDDENIGDADPIDVSLSSERVTIGDFIVPFRKTLLTLTQAGAQFELNSPEALTPGTAVITPTTMYNTLSVRPDTIGLRVYLPCTDESTTQLREYFFTDTAAAADAPDISVHAKGYLPTTVRTLRACPNDDTVLILPTPGTSLYVYRTYFDGNKRLQSAWSKYTFTGADKICDIAVIDSKCYMLVDDADGFRFLSVPVAYETPSDTIRLDNKVLDGGVYSSGTNRTTWTLDVPDGSLTHAIRSGATAFALTKTDSTHYWATGDCRGATGTLETLGAAYTMTTELTQMYRRDQDGAPLLDNVLQLVKLVLNHQNSGPYSLTITQPLSRTRTITYTPSTSPETEGKSNFYILGNAKDTTLMIQATGPKPVAISAGECAVTFNQLSR